jgi:hypothetical protein
MDRNTIEFIVGAFFVGIYAFSRFSSTRTDRHLPVSSRYTFALVIYITLTILIYFLLSLVLTAGIALPFIGLREVTDDIRKIFSSENQVLSTQLLVALLMTEALPRVKKLKEADRQLRILFQRMASLSATAQSLSSKFQYEALDLQDGQLRAIEKAMTDQGFETKDIQIKKDKSPQHIWTRVSLLWSSLSRWEETPVYQMFLNSHSSEMKRLKSENESLANKAMYCFKLSAAAEKDPELHRALSDCTNIYTTQLKQHLQKLADFLSRGLLAAQKGDARSDAIVKMGFKAELNQGLSVDHLTLMFIMLFVIMMIGFGFSRWVADPASQRALISTDSFLKAIMIASIYSIGIVCALMAKWRCDQKGNTKNAWATYFLFAVLASVMGSMVSIFVGTIIKDWNMVEGFERFIAEKWPWQFMVFTTTFFTAFLLNQDVDQKEGVLKNRFWEAGIMAAALLFALFLAGGLMGFSADIYMQTGMIAIVVGFSIGFFIPSWYRGAPRRDKEQLNNMIQYAGLTSRH